VPVLPQRRHRIHGHTLSEPFASLIHATRTTNGTKTATTLTTADTPDDATTKHLSGLLASALAGQSASKAAIVEVLTAYSHSTQATDLHLCTAEALTSPCECPRPSAKRPQRLRDHLDERDIADLITAHREGTTATSLAG
jgi:hypothetical protein